MRALMPYLHRMDNEKQYSKNILLPIHGDSANDNLCDFNCYSHIRRK